jgi:hypothetical protein
MRVKILLFVIVISFCVKPIKSFAQVNIQDSLALVDYYDSTYGVSPWQGDQSWDLQAPVSTWLGIGVRGNRVISIKLWGGGHAGHIPSSFGNLTALERIEFLDYRQDATLPESFKNLINLTSVYFHAVFYMVPFPVVLTKLPNLKVIDMENNLFIDSLPSSIGNMVQLTTLDVNDCFVNSSKIPSELGNLKNLDSLLLFNNHFYGTIPASLANLDSLTTLDLSSNDLSGNIPGLARLKKLNNLFLNDNEFTFKELEPFAQSINDKIEKFEYLNLSPQAIIPITFYPASKKLAISPGGTLSNNTFKWYKVGGELVATITGDSTYIPNTNGKYYVDITNSIATGVTLSSDTIDYDYVLPEIDTTTHIVVSANITHVNIGFLKIATIQSTPGDNPLTGDVNISVSFDPFFPRPDKEIFVDRHYDITPVENADKAEAIITLYFTQEDFDKFNDFVTTYDQPFPLLPTGGVDNGHIVISQFHGTYDSTLKKYSGSSVDIIPTVVWNSDNNWWEISFPVRGFSGFYLTTVNSTLPLTLLNFNGKKEASSVALKWQTTNEINSRQFIIQRSNGSTFNDIGTIPAQSTKGINNYTFTDENPYTGKNLYRLKMMDFDGHFTYSDVVIMNFSTNKTNLKLYPNPAKSILNLKINSEKPGNIKLKIMNVSGEIVYQKILGLTAGENSPIVNIQSLPAGTYYLNVYQNGKIEKIGFVKE